ncbi:MAG: hypothetical protein P8J50_13090 [Acidimicrobiales bacterium]|nr:hypothetical protein [Acidimicrobiales bacterium]
MATAAALWAVHQPPRSLLIVAGAILVVFVEVVLTDRRVSQLGVEPAIDKAAVVAAGGLSATVAAMALSVLLPESVERGIEWAYAGAILGFGWAFRDVRLARRSDVAWTRLAADGGPSALVNWGMVAATVAALVLARGPATAAVVSAVAAAAFLVSRRPGRLAIAWTCAGGAALLAVGANAWLAAGVALSGLVVISVVAVLLASDDLVLGRQGLLGVAAPVAVAGMAIGDHSVIGGAVVAAVGLWLVALIVDVADPQAAFVARVLGAAVLVISVSVDAELSAWSLLAMALALIAHLTATRQTSSAVMAVATGGLALAVAFSDRWTAPVVVAALVVGLVGVSLVAFGLDRLLLPRQRSPARSHTPIRSWRPWASQFMSGPPALPATTVDRRAGWRSVSRRSADARSAHGCVITRLLWPARRRRSRSGATRLSTTSSASRVGAGS